MVKQLTPEQKEILLREGTEHPGSSKIGTTHMPQIYTHDRSRQRMGRPATNISRISLGTA